MANPEKWGPPLWRILHTYAERLGQYSSGILLQDERRAWINFIRSVEATLPCVKCRDHFRRWRREHPVEDANLYVGDSLRSWAREWLFNLHNEVNTENGKPCPTLEEIIDLYKARTKYEQSDDIRTLYEHFQQAILMRILPPPAFHDFKLKLSMVQRLLY